MKRSNISSSLNDTQERSVKEEVMSGMEMQITGGILLAGGLIFFAVSQILLNKWYKSYMAELDRLG